MNPEATPTSIGDRYSAITRVQVKIRVYLVKVDNQAKITVLKSGEFFTVSLNHKNLKKSYFCLGYCDLN